MQKRKLPIINHQTKISQTGFTLIEMLVVIAIIAVIATMSTQIVLSIIRSNNKTNIQHEVRQNGSFVLDRMEREIRSSTGATVTLNEQPACGPGPNCYLLRLTQSDGVTIAYWCNPGSATSNGFIDRQRGTEARTTIINNNQTSGVRVQDCNFSTQPEPPILVNLKFTLNQAYNSPTRSDLTVSQIFTTTVSLRTY